MKNDIAITQYTMNKNSLTTTQLYQKVLEIGSDCTHCVITYKYVRDKLCLGNCYDEELIDEFLAIWFSAIFQHDDYNCKEEKDEFGPLNYNEKHLKKCNHYLSTNSILQLHQFETSNKNYYSSLFGLAISIIAIIISFAILCVQCSKKPIDYSVQLENIDSLLRTLDTSSIDNAYIINQHVKPSNKAEQLDSLDYYEVELNIERVGPKLLRN